MSSHVTYDDVLARAEMRTQDTNAAFVITSDNVGDYQAPFAASRRDAAVSRAKKKSAPFRYDSIGLGAYTLHKKTRVRKSI